MTRPKPALVFIFITLVLDILGIGLIIPILPKLVKELQGGSIAEASLVYGMLPALYSLMQFLCAPILGNLSDRFGRRPVILISLCGSGLDYFVLAFAPNLAWFFVGRIIAGITGANFAAACAYIADVSPPEKRAANFGLIGAAFGLGFILGPALGGTLGQYGLRIPFMVAGGLTLLNWLYGLLLLPESLDPKNRRAFSLIRANPVGALLDLKRYPAAFALAGSYFLIYVAHQVFPSTWVLYTDYRYGWTERQTGLSLSVVGIMAALIQGGLARFVVRGIGEQKAAACGLAIAAISYVGYGLATEGWMLYAILIFGSLGGITNPAIQGLISRGVRADEQGCVQGALSSLTAIAGIIGPPIAAGLFGHFIDKKSPVHIPGIAFFFSAVLVFGALLLALRSFRRNPVPVDSPRRESVAVGGIREQ